MDENNDHEQPMGASDIDSFSEHFQDRKDSNSNLSENQVKLKAIANFVPLEHTRVGSSVFFLMRSITISL